MAAKKKQDAHDDRNALMKELEAALAKVPPAQLKEAKKKADEVLKNESSWAQLFDLPPENLQKFAEIGYQQFKAGSYKEAEKVFRGLTTVDPNNYYYHQMMGACCQRQENYAEAILEYSIAVDLNPKDAVSLTNRGESYVRMGLPPLAAHDFEQAIELDSKGENRWANRARMLKEQLKMIKKGNK